MKYDSIKPRFVKSSSKSRILVNVRCQNFGVESFKVILEWSHFRSETENTALG